MVDNWKELGFALTLSSTSTGTEEDNEYICQLLKLAEEANIKVIVADQTVLFDQLPKIGKEEYENRVRDLCRRFSTYKSFDSLFICDEPHLPDFDNLKECLSIIRKYGKAYINFLAIHAVVGCVGFENYTEEEYLSYIEDLIRNYGLSCVSYDFYQQCDYHYSKKGVDSYFYNLEKFGDLARRNNVPLFVSNLSVEHWNYRKPTLDDIRWQISTSLAMGASSILWFYLYERDIESSYRNAPINFFKEKQETFYSLKREDYMAKEFAKSLEGYEYAGSYFVEDRESLKKVCLDLGIDVSASYQCHLLFTKFVKADQAKICITNLEQKDIEAINIGEDRILYFAPGQIYAI